MIRTYVGDTGLPLSKLTWKWTENFFSLPLGEQLRLYALAQDLGINSIELGLGSTPDRTLLRHLKNNRDAWILHIRLDAQRTQYPCTRKALREATEQARKVYDLEFFEFATLPACPAELAQIDAFLDYVEQYRSNGFFDHSVLLDSSPEHVLRTLAYQEEKGLAKSVGVRVPINLADATISQSLLRSLREEKLALFADPSVLRLRVPALKRNLPHIELSYDEFEGELFLPIESIDRSGEYPIVVADSARRLFANVADQVTTYAHPIASFLELRAWAALASVTVASVQSATDSAASIPEPESSEIRVDGTSSIRPSLRSVAS